MTINEPSSETLIVILNPQSGSSDGDYRGRIERSLGARHEAFEIRETTEERNGAAIAREARAEGAIRVMACGGDGTVMQVINGLGPNGPGRPPVTLTVVPGGTANLLASALGIPDDVDEAVALAFEGTDRDIDLGRRDDTLFVLGIGVGLTERLVSQASSSAKERIGRLAYLFAMLKEIGARPQTFELKLDERESSRIQGVAVVIMNVGDLGGGMDLVPDARPDDGFLDVCVLRRFGPFDALRIGFKTLVGRLREERAMEFHQARRVELRADPPIEVQIDGEPIEAKTPIVAESIALGLRIRVPFPTKTDAPEDSTKTDVLAVTR